MYSVEQLPDGTQQATLSIEGVVFRSTYDVDVLVPVRPVPGMDLELRFDSAADPGTPLWTAVDRDEEWSFLCSADTPEGLLAKIRVILTGRLISLVGTYNSLFRFDDPAGPAKLSL